jgi:uncharacterized protein (DUF1800 family)
MEFFLPLGVEGTIDRLVVYDKVDEGFSINPMDFAGKNKNGQPVLRIQSLMAWWALRLITTARPLQEKLTLFWHDHFAVSASKVNQAPMMLQYNDTLRRNASGSFLDLLQAMSKDAAMIKWLDNDTNVKGKPNENFAREVMELFTLGIGNYTEKDVQEAARAFTGWGFRVRSARPRKRPTPEEIAGMISKGEPVFEFQLRTGLHDTGTKAILGSEGNFDGDDVCGMLAAHKETSRTIARKLWEWFAYENPEPAIIDKLSKVYFDGGMQIRKMLMTIVESDQFWSDKCVRKLIKNPADFTVSIYRQLGIGVAAMKAMQDGGRQRAALGPARSAETAMERQGMKLFYPPDVAGWDWGKAWISSATMIERIKVADGLFGNGTAAAALASSLLGRSRSESETIVDMLLHLVDATVSESHRKTLVDACKEASDGADQLPRAMAPRIIESVFRALFASPEFQFC